MTKPTILAVDDDPAVSRAVTRDLRARYGADYRIVRATSGREALSVLAELALRDQAVALVASDQRMPEMTGIQVLEEVRRVSPGRKLLLLTAYADTDVAIKAINDIGLDYYMLKPWDPPEERLYPVIDDLLGDWTQEHPDETADVRVVGHRWSDRSHDVKTFLARNHVPYRWLDVESDPEAQRLSTWPTPGPRTCRWCSCRTEGRCGRRRCRTWPTRSGCGPGRSSRSTTCASSAEARPASQPPCTPRRRGCGPSWWSGTPPAARPARVRRSRTTSGSPGALRGRPHAPGRRPGRAVRRRDGAGPRRGRVREPRPGPGGALRGRRRGRGAGGAGGDRGLLPATGRTRCRAAQRPRRLLRRGGERGPPVPGRGRLCRRCGQLGRPGGPEFRPLRETGGDGRPCGRARGHHVAVPGRRIHGTANIAVRVRTKVVAAQGDGHLERLTLADRASVTEEEVSAGWLFVFIGASPRTEWLGSDVVRDDEGLRHHGPGPARLGPGLALAAGPGAVRTGDERPRRVRRR